MQARLIGIRKYHKESQETVAKLIGISRELYSKSENGSREFRSNEMFTLAEHYNVPIGSLFLPNDFTSHEGGE